MADDRISLPNHLEAVAYRAAQFALREHLDMCEARRFALGNGQPSASVRVDRLEQAAARRKAWMVVLGGGIVTVAAGIVLLIVELLAKG